jgi:hypothetical protein
MIALTGIKQQFSNTPGEEISVRDLTLLLFPLTPVVQYSINNPSILLWFEHIIVFCIFALFTALFIFVIPVFFSKTGSTRGLMFIGLAFTFTITNMASLTSQYSWYEEGSLKIQLLIMGSIWLISILLFKLNLRTFLHLLVVVYFFSNSIFQLFDRQESIVTPVSYPAENKLVTLINAREPVVTPNIYLLIYDSYVVNETMLAYGLNNQAQEQYLEEQGFKIYPHTYSIDGESLGTMVRTLNSSTSYYGNKRKAVSGDGIVQNLLKEFGYTTYGIFPSDYYFRGIIPSYDYSFPGYRSSVGLIAKAIIMGEFRFDVDFHKVSREQYLSEKESSLSEELIGPKFIYTHSKFPDHSQNSGVCLPNEVELYGERLVEANLEMRQDVALIIEEDPEAIIIVAGDHGPYLTKNCFKTRDEYDISEISRLDIQDRLGTFLAIRWPASGFELYDDITVMQDLFPAIFAYIFEDPGLLEAQVEPITLDPTYISGASINDGMIVGGIHDGEALFQSPIIEQ